MACNERVGVGSRNEGRSREFSRKSRFRAERRGIYACRVSRRQLSAVISMPADKISWPCSFRPTSRL